MFLTSLWLPWVCVLHTQSMLLLQYEVTHLKYAAWREHYCLGVWNSTFLPVLFSQSAEGQEHLHTL